MDLTWYRLGFVSRTGRRDQFLVRPPFSRIAPDLRETLTERQDTPTLFLLLETHWKGDTAAAAPLTIVKVATPWCMRSTVNSTGLFMRVLLSYLLKMRSTGIVALRSLFLLLLIIYNNYMIYRRYTTKISFDSW
jgi:hypothetical protein